jgi:hypothetical protein
MRKPVCSNRPVVGQVIERHKGVWAIEDAQLGAVRDLREDSVSSSGPLSIEGVRRAIRVIYGDLQQLRPVFSVATPHLPRPIARAGFSLMRMHREEWVPIDESEQPPHARLGRVLTGLLC